MVVDMVPSKFAEYSDLVVYVVEDDEAMRASISDVLSDNQINFRIYATPSECIEQYDDQPGCFLFDLRLPEMDGLELQKRLKKQGSRLPFIMISGNGDIPTAVESMRTGAIDFLEKPFRSQQLTEAIEKAFVKISRELDINRRLASLTHREREFLTFLVQGKSVKAISNEFEISPKTGHVHRRNIHQKLAVDCDAALVKLLEGFSV